MRRLFASRGPQIHYHPHALWKIEPQVVITTICQYQIGRTDDKEVRFDLYYVKFNRMD